MKSSLYSDRKVRKYLFLPTVLLAMSFFVVGQSHPARAKDVCTSCAVAVETSWMAEVMQYAEQFSLLADIISALTTVNDWMDKLNDETSKLTATVYSTNYAMTKANVDLAEGLGDIDTKNTIDGVSAKIAAEHAPPPPGNQQLCNLTIVGQAQLVMSWFSDQVARALLMGVEQMYLVGDGKGPQYAADNWATRCPSATNMPKFGNPLRGYSSSCVDSDKDFIDADISFKTIDGTQLLEMPQILPRSVGTTTVYVPNPENKEQKMWVAAMHYLYNAAGPRPTPPYGSKMQTPQGMPINAAFNNCAADQSTLIYQCSKWIGKLTRPNCKGTGADPNLAPVCQAGFEACKAYQAATNGAQMPPGFDCSKGLSLYQAEYIDHAKCLSNQHVQDSAGTGINHGSIIMARDICSQSMAAWRAQIAAEMGNCLNAVRGLNEIKKCWPDNQGSPTIKAKAPSRDAERRNTEQVSAKAVTSVSEKPTMTPARSADKMPRGVPVSADEITLPDVVSQ